MFTFRSDPSALFDRLDPSLDNTTIDTSIEHHHIDTPADTPSRHCGLVFLG